MKFRQSAQLLIILLLLLLTACDSEKSSTSSSATRIPSRQVTSTPARQATPIRSQVAPIAQQHLPKSLLNASYPVMDWVFNVTCDAAGNSYANSQMRTAIAYDSAAWLYPTDGHLVEGWQNCDSAALLGQARNSGLPTLLTVGIDSSWSEQTVAQYIDRASSEPQVPCDASAATAICMIVNWASAGGYSGVIIDFEIVSATYPNIRQKFATFMHKLQDALHSRGLLCGIALIHKVSDRPQEDTSFSGNYFEDWKLLAELDFLVAMVLDFDLSQHKAGPLVSIPLLEKQLLYIWRTIPQALSKIIFEFPLYGREWQQDAQGTWHSNNYETCQQVNVQKATYPLLSNVSTDPTTPEIAWNDGNGNRHEVWYDTASSLVAIMTQIQKEARVLLNDPHYRLPTSFWYRGAECAGFFGMGNALETFYK